MSDVPSTIVSQDFKKEVRHLLERWKPIKQGYADLAKKHLEFAKLIFELWETARALDRKSRGDLHKDYMRQQLQVLVQTDDASILSRWRSIGAQSRLPQSASDTTRMLHSSWLRLTTRLGIRTKSNDWVDASSGLQTACSMSRLLGQERMQRRHRHGEDFYRLDSRTIPSSQASSKSHRGLA